MRFRGVTAAALACTAISLTVGGGAGAAKAPAGVRGHFSLLIMAHTLASIPQFSVPATTPWNGALRRASTFSYRSIPCTGNAPLNNVSSDLPTYNARVAGSRPPASMRAQPFQFQLQKTKKGWGLRGRIDFTVCNLTGGPNPATDPVPDVNKPKIFITFRTKLASRAPESISWFGTFKIVGGTERYAGLKGSGRIGGYFFCFAPEGCPAKGAYLDTQMVLEGTYSDPTPQLTG